MQLHQVKVMLKMYLTELKCELTGWNQSIPVEVLKDWIKKVETRILRKIDDSPERIIENE